MACWLPPKENYLLEEIDAGRMNLKSLFRKQYMLFMRTPGWLKETSDPPVVTRQQYHDDREFVLKSASRSHMYPRVDNLNVTLYVALKCSDTTLQSF